MGWLADTKEWLRNPPTDWRFFLLTAVVTFLSIAAEETVRYLLLIAELSTEHYMFWCVTPISLLMFLVWGQRVFFGVFVGGLIGFLPWFSPFAALVGALDGAVQVSLGIWLVRRFWPQYIPLQPSVRFFAIVFGMGVVVPVFLVSLPTVFVFSFEMMFHSGYWGGYLEWCLSEMAGTLVLLPVLLMVVYPSFRKTVERPLELVPLILLGIFLMIGSVLIEADRGGGDEIMPMEAWVLVGTTGFAMVVRNGVGGVIIANLAMAVASMGVQVYLGSENPAWINQRMLVEFNMFSCHLMALTLLIAAGFHDFKMLNNASRGITARMLNVQVAERRRLAADLHDSVSQEFAAALMRLRAGMAETEPAQARESLSEAERILASGLQDLRRMAVGLRPELLEHSAFADVIEAYCEETEARHGVDILFINEIAEGMPRLSLEKREHLFRILQESLGNAIRHGKAQTITVTLQSCGKQERYRALIEDDGVGFDTTVAVDMADRPHLGLRLMEERALIVGGSFRIRSQAGKGTRVEITVPFDDSGETGLT